MTTARSSYLLIATDVSERGGIGAYTGQFASSLGRVDPEAAGTLVTLNLHKGVSLPRQWKVRNIRNRLHFVLRTLFTAAIARPTDIVLFHVSLAWLAWLAARLSGARLTVITYGWDVSNSPRRFPRVVGARADRMVAISRHTAEAAELYFYPWVPRRFDDFFILPPSFDLERFVPDPDARGPFRAANELGDDDIVLLTVGRLDPSEQGKGHDRVIRSLPALLADEPNLVYLIVGEGEDGIRLRDLTQRLGLDDHVRFVGFREDLPACYAGSDLFVMPSTQEGFGIVFVESMACGRAVVAGGVDGSISAVLFGEVGFLCDPNEPASLQRAVRSALEGLREGDPRADPKIIRTRAVEEFGPSAFDARLRELLGS